MEPWKPAQINWNAIPVKGVGGLIFTIGMLVLIAVAFPQIPAFLLPAILLGAIAGLGLYLWRNRRK